MKHTASVTASLLGASAADASARPLRTNCLTRLRLSAFWWNSGTTATQGRAEEDAAPHEGRAFWGVSLPDLLGSLHVTPSGLDTAEAKRRFIRCGPNTIASATNHRIIRLLLRQFGTPIVLLLIGAASLSLAVHDRTDGAIILAIVVVSGILGFWQEWKAANIVTALLSQVELQATVVRDGHDTVVPVSVLVPGDILVVSAGSAIPADCRVLTSRDLFVNEAPLTGESYPVEKSEGQVPDATPLARRTNAIFMGTHAVSGTARAVVVRTGASTEFGGLSAHLGVEPAKTEFERGLRRFGYFLIEVTLVLVTVIFALNVLLHKPVLDSFLFALALAVGLTPQLLPAIVSVVLANGAKNMARRKVIVKRLTAIENFGSMDVLCSDKTGTLTEGRMRLESALDVRGRESDRVGLYAYVNAQFQTGYANPIDTAICERGARDLTGWTKLDEIPYDFVRRRLSVLVTDSGSIVMVSKGALGAVLDACSHAEADGDVIPIDEVRAATRYLQARLEKRGFRTLGVAIRE